MVNRKFTESEVRAYTKNRHEDKVLKKQLEKLNAECGNYHDLAAKQRTILLAENTNICMTSGESPIPNECVNNVDYDLSKRFKRPWAYSVMETTYNAKYRESVLPLPKPTHKRWRSKSEAGIHTGISKQEFTNRTSSLDYSRTAAAIQRSKSCLSAIKLETQSDTARAPSVYEENTLDLDLKESKMLNVNSSHTIASKRTFSDTNLDLTEGRYPVIVTTENGIETNENMQSTVDTFQRPYAKRREEEYIKLENFKLEELYTLEKKHDLFMPKVISLPKVYEIEMESKKRTMKDLLRRSRVDFNLPVTTAGHIELHDGQIKNDENKADVDVDANIVNNTTDQSVVLTDNKEYNVSVINTNISEETQKEKLMKDRPKTVMSVRESSKAILQKRRMSEQSVSVEIRNNLLSNPAESDREEQCVDIFYKGKRIRNYIKPQERYRLDPVIARRRQMKMDRLAKESVTYLSRVNHENTRVDIAFPRAARARILNQLVKENNSKRNKTPCNLDSVLLKLRVEEFMKSISNYISKQKEETF